MEKKKIAFFGGTFDPIHIGHTTVASIAADHIGAENIVFIPAKCSPLKRFFPQASDKHRLKMTAIAIENDKRFRISDHEIKKSEPCFTLETLRWFRAQYTKDTLFYWLIGADTIGDLGLWYKVTELLDECNLCTMYRAGCDVPDFSKYEDIWGRKRIEKLQGNIIETPLVDVSSTQIRSRLSGGDDVSEMLSLGVAQYIRKHHLYQSCTG